MELLCNLTWALSKIKFEGFLEKGSLMSPSKQNNSPLRVSTYIYSVYKTHWNIIFNILDKSFFQKYAFCWVFLTQGTILYFLYLCICICVRDTW